MSLVSSYFNSNLLYEEYQGPTGNSEAIGEPIQIKGRIEPSNKIIRTLDKGDIASSTVIYTEYDVKRLSYISFGGDRLQVISVKPLTGLDGKTVYNEVYLG